MTALNIEGFWQRIVRYVAEQLDLYRRAVSYTRKPSDSLAFSALTTVISPAAMTMRAGRRYKFTIDVLFAGTAAANAIGFYLFNVGDNTYHKRWRVEIPTAGAVLTATLTWVTETSMSGSHTWRLDASRQVGAGTLDVYGVTSITPNATATAAPRFSALLIEDMGPL